MWSHGVMVSTQDSESCNPSSNLGGTFFSAFISFCLCQSFSHHCHTHAIWSDLCECLSKHDANTQSCHFHILSFYMK